MKALNLNTDLGFAPIEIADDELPFGAVIVLVTRGMSDHGQFTRISTRSSRDLDFITYRGMIEMAHDECVKSSPMMQQDDEDDDEDPV